MGALYAVLAILLLMGLLVACLAVSSGRLEREVEAYQERDSAGGTDGNGEERLDKTT